MRKFVFRLESIRRLRAGVEREKRREFAAAAAAYNRERHELVRLEREAEEKRGALRKELDGPCRLEKLRNMENYLLRLQETVVAQRQRTEEAWHFMEVKRRELVEASRERKVMDKLRERQLEEYLYELAREEQSFLDEVAGGRFVARAQGAEEAGNN